MIEEKLIIKCTEISQKKHPPKDRRVFSDVLNQEYYFAISA